MSAKKETASTKPISSPKEIPDDKDYFITGLLFSVDPQTPNVNRFLIGHTTCREPRMGRGTAFASRDRTGYYRVMGVFRNVNEASIIKALNDSIKGREMLELIAKRKGLVVFPLTVYALVFHKWSTEDVKLKVEPKPQSTTSFQCRSCNEQSNDPASLKHALETDSGVQDVKLACEAKQKLINWTEILSYGFISGPNLSLWSLVKESTTLNWTCNACRMREIGELSDDDVLGLYYENHTPEG